MRFETLTIHAGQEPDPNNGAVMKPNGKGWIAQSNQYK